MIVTATSGKTVNMREQPNINGKLVCTVPIGTNVEMIEKVNSEWSQIKYNAMSGYMMTKFLTDDTGAINRADLQRIYNSLAATLKTIEEVLK